ncbi:MAG: class I SAM-dependent methyltransferase [Halococcoides sp.]
MAESADRPAHRLFSDLGKRVLRPGGRALTDRLIDHLDPRSGEDIVEFAPGTGATAERLLARDPGTYRGIDLDSATVADLRDRLGGPNQSFMIGHAAETGFDRSTADVCVTEAMLTMQSDAGVTAIVEEAERLLRPGGRYGFHELAVRDGVPAERQERIAADLEAALGVPARPRTESDWIETVEREGFDIEWTGRAPMALLDPRRLVADEGLLGALTFGATLLRDGDARRRVRSIRATFHEHDDALVAVAAVGRA